MRKINRRNLLKSAAVAGAVATLPKSPLADHRPQAVDLAIRRIEWSTDGGLTWGTGEIKERAPVLLRAVVANTGEMTAPGNRPLRVDFYVNGELVAISDHHRSGLAADEEVVLEANTGPMGDPTWDDAEVGSLSIKAVVDPDDLFPSEHDETNVREVETEAVTVSDALSVVGQIAGFVTGGIPGMIGGGFIGATIGYAVDKYKGELTASSMIGYRDPPGNGGGFFPERADRVAVAFGSSVEWIELAVKLHQNATKTPHAWWKHSNPKIYGTDGCIDELANSIRAAKGYLVLHPGSQWAGNGNTDEFRDLLLFAWKFFNLDGVAISGGGRPSGEGTDAFYNDCCSAAGISTSYRAKMAHVCVNAGFHGCAIPHWRSGIIKMDHSSVLGLSLNLRPTPTGGTSTRRHGLRAMIHYIDAIGDIVPNVGLGRWHDFLVRRAKARGAQAQSTPGAWWAILREFVRFGRRHAAMRQGVIQGMRADGWGDEALLFVDAFIQDFFFATGMENEIMSEFCEVLLDHIKVGEEGPARPVEDGVYFITRPTAPNLRDRYVEVIELYQAWKEGRVIQGVFVSKVGTVSWR
jgi:TAT (twin-arginine translocation) pathway signal sequence/CARDB